MEQDRLEPVRRSTWQKFVDFLEFLDREQSVPSRAEISALRADVADLRERLGMPVVASAQEDRLPDCRGD